MGDSGSWCLIESDPAVFNELMRGFGVDGLDCIEVYDTRSTDSFNDALGLIFLFKWDGNGRDALQSLKYVESGSIFFAKQVITNACATQALINVLFNLPPASLKLGDTLTDFKSFVSDFDSQMKGTALANCEKLRLAHNSFARPQVFEIDLNKPCKPEDVYHYVGFVPINDAVYELDGLKPNPIRVASIPEGASWLDVILPIVAKRMSECVDGRFNLMALVPSRLQMYEARAAEYQTNPPEDKNLIGQNECCIFAERARIAEQRSENNRRRHNYLPFIIELLKVLAEKNLLTDVVHRAKERSQNVQTPTNA
ncbi:Ubiquitin carboxyl-terminal hydrolase isozyme L5 [Taenia solium]|eukprot:TsM_000763000 transcript=TsM_000763000 gene=TsM_000763000